MTLNGKNKRTDELNQYLTVKLCNESFGIPVTRIKDIFTENRITYIPLADPDIIGAINLRGRIVAAIDMRKRFGLPPADKTMQRMNIAVEYGDELCSLVVDSVGDVILISDDQIDALPPTLDSKWKTIATGVFKQKNDLLIILRMDNLIQNSEKDPGDAR